MSILAINSFFNLYNRHTAKQQAKMASDRYSGFNPNTSRVVAPYKEDTVELSQKEHGHTGWIEIPSKNHDTKNYSSNLQMLNFLWDSNWKKQNYSMSDAPSLGKALINSDFHIYYENGKPMMAAQMDHESELVQVYGLDDKEDREKYSEILRNLVLGLKRRDYSLFY